MLWICLFMETERRGLSQGGGAPVLEVLVRVGVPVWDHRGTQELVVAVCGSPLSPIDGPAGCTHTHTQWVAPSLCATQEGEGNPCLGQSTVRFWHL